MALHYFIGNLGHLFVIIAFVTSLVSAFAYARSMQAKDLIRKNQWLVNARISFWIHTGAVVSIFVVLYTIISKHYFEYHYAYAHSSLHLPAQYMVSCFWEGQEGSFLLWMLWQSILGLILMRTQSEWEAPVMVIFATVHPIARRHA